MHKAPVLKPKREGSAVYGHEHPRPQGLCGGSPGTDATQSLTPTHACPLSTEIVSSACCFTRGRQTTRAASTCAGTRSSPGWTASVSVPSAARSKHLQVAASGQEAKQVCYWGLCPRGLDLAVHVKTFTVVTTGAGGGRGRRVLGLTAYQVCVC